jgi:penicillin-binding protein 1C
LIGRLRALPRPAPRLRRALAALALLALALVLLRAWPHAPLREHASTSRAFYSSDGTLLRLTLAHDEQYRVWTPLAQIDPKLVQAVLLYEDRWFHQHPGFNPVSLVRAAWGTWRGPVRRGGSTLTMQLARRLYGLDTRTPVGKLQQVAAAAWLELRHGKAEILEAYLNLAPYGGNIEGVGAASLVYFGKRAQQLLLPEALALAVIPQNPNRRGSVGAGEGANTAPPWPQALAAARARLWATWQQRYPASTNSADAAAMALPLVLRSPRQLPFAAPHAVQTLMLQRVTAPETTLTLHGPTQAVLERAIAQFIQTRRGLGVSNAAALLIDTETRAVRAWVGSADWRDEAIDGQVNATTAKRSPGSTLKPFIYALGLDQGLLHPHTVLKDAPSAFGTYHPENFDGRFEGPITAQDALVRSRNVPAVAVSSRLQQPTLHGFLKAAGVSRLASEQHYGLALTLGGGEVTMEELAQLYLLLARGGQHPGHPALRTLASDDTSTTPRRLLSPEAAWVTLQMLARNPRPDTGQPAFPPVAWKTGTSWGFRDAWTAGVFGRQVLVVWVGHFDGRSNAAFVGVQTAAPLFFQIVDSLRHQGLAPPASEEPRGLNLAQVLVCKASGELPNEACPERVPTWFIPGVSPIRVSTLHRALWVHRPSGRAVCGPGPGVEREVFEHWGPDMLQLFAQAGMPRRVPPAPPRCGNAATGRDLGESAGSGATVPGDEGPLIASPLQGARYVLRLGRAEEAGLSLRAHTRREGALFWFADEAFLGRSAPGQDLRWRPPAAGRYTLAAVDSEGASSTREVVVEFAP